MQTHEVKPQTKRKIKKTVGRGGQRGKTSGRGTKGQNSRAGRKKRPEFRDILKKLPKKRGYKFKSITSKPIVVSLGQLELWFNKGETVSPTTLGEKGLRAGNGFTNKYIKVLNKGTLTKPLVFKECRMSETAKELILKIGGTIQ